MWLDVYNATTTESVQLLPIIPVIGDHECEIDLIFFDQAYNWPSGGSEKNYSVTKLTSEIGIVILNNMVDPVRGTIL